MPKISELTAATSVAAADTIPVVQGGVTKRATANLLGGLGQRVPTPQSQNLKGWAKDPADIGASVTTLASNTLYLAKILVPESVSLANVHLVIGTTAAAGVTNAYAAIILPDGTVTRQTADQAAAVNAAAVGTALTLPLSSAVTVGGATDFVYAAFGYGAVTTNPSVGAFTASAHMNAAVNLGLSVGAYRFASLSNSTWPLPATVTLANQTQTATNKNVWMAVS